MDRSAADVVPALAGIVMMVLGIAAIAGVLWWRRTTAGFRSWRAVEGMITSSEAECREGVWWPKIEYTYAVEGRPYTARQVFLRGEFVFGDRRRHTERVVGELPAGSRVTVYVHPERPTTCALFEGAGGISAIVTVLGVVLVVSGVMIAFSP